MHFWRRANPSAFRVFFLFLFLYLSTTRGLLEYGDDVSMLEVTRAMVTRGAVDVPEHTPGAAAGLDGRYYSKYGIGQSLLAVPLLSVGLHLHRVVPLAVIIDDFGFERSGTAVLVAALLGAVSSAAAIALLFASCRCLGLSSASSLAAASALGVGTFAWHYSRAFMTEPTTMATIMMACYASLRYDRQARLKWLWLSGCAVGLSFLLRTSNVLLLGPYGVWLLSWIWRRHPLPPKRWLAIIAAGAGPVLAAAVVVAAYNHHRFGSPLETGYGAEASRFTTPLITGVTGLLFSSGKSVFLYAPILILAMTGWRSLYRRAPWLAVLAALTIAEYVVFYARFHVWFGGGAWGPRFLAPILPLFMFALAAAAEGGGAWWRRTFAVAMVTSVFVQLSSILVPYVPYEARMEATPQSFERLLWSPVDSPIVAHARSLVQHEFPLDIAANYYQSPMMWNVQLASFVLSSALLVSAAAAVRRRSPRLRSDATAGASGFTATGS